MRSRRLRARDGRDDDTETTTRTNEISFHSRSVLTPSIVVAASSSTRGGRRESRIRPHSCDASRCMRTSRLTTGARRARALGRAHRVHRRGRPREHRLRAHLPRDGLPTVARATSAGPPRAPWGAGGLGFRVHACRGSIDRPIYGKTPCTYGVFEHTPF